ncbi:MAG: DUF2934 domain-containing protein [Candidatus Melainabacteria bacterium]|nr:DUF2934 domain-containing protein [Candidatus Melainabacteria bacterium]
MLRSRSPDKLAGMSTEGKRKSRKTGTEESQSKDCEAQVTFVHRELVSRRAYQIWEKRGCAHGFDLENWLLAEKEILDESLS